MTSQLVREARMFATIKHQGQKRKYTFEPYIIHPAAVAKTVEYDARGTDEMIAAAWLHDTVEDTDTTTNDILRDFGDIVASYVEYLTDDNKEGNRAARKARYALVLKDAPYQVKTIKLADLIDNTGDIVKHDPNFARVYLAEKRELLDVLRGGDPRLWMRANTQLTQGLIKLIALVDLK